MALSVRQNTTTAKQAGAGNGFALSAFGSNLIVGNSLIVAVSHYNTALPGVSDSDGNSYVMLCRCNRAGTTGNDGVSLFWCPSIGVADKPTITVSNTSAGSSTQFWSASALESTPCVPSVLSNGAYGTGTTLTANSLTTLVATSLVIAIAGSNGSNSFSFNGSGFTQFGAQTTVSENMFDAQYQVYSSIQTGLSLMWTAGGSETWEAIAIAMIAASSGGAALSRQFLGMGG